MQKAYSKLQIKSFEDESRIIRGVATTPSTDRYGDSVIPGGAKFALPIPLLWQHDSSKPIGHVTAAKITDEGIEIEAKIMQVAAPNGLAARLDEAWESVKSGLVRGLSIGFKPIKYELIKETGGVEFQEWDFYELSVVTIPANAEASITAIKNFAAQQSAALGAAGEKTQAALGLLPVKLQTVKKGSNMNIQEIIKRLEDTKSAKVAERDALQEAVAKEGRTKSAQERENFDTLSDEIKALDLELKDMRQLEQQNIAKAAPVEAGAAQAKDYAGIAVQKAPENLEKGIAFARFAGVIGAAKGDLHTAKSIAEHRFPDDKRLHHIMKAAVAAGTTQDPAFAGRLVEYQQISNDFIEFLRPKTIIGQFGAGSVPALRSIPFNVTIKGQNVGGTAGWVGEGKHKPLTAQGFTTVNLGFFKLAAITAASDELLRFSNPSAERLIRDDLAAAVISEMDSAFIAIANAGVANVKPASITNSLTAYTTGTGDPEADIAALWTAAVSANADLSSAVYVTTPAVAMKLAGLKSAADNRRFPDVTVLGGTINGVPLIVSSKVDAGAFILAFASDIFLADDGVVTIDASREASLIMDSDPQALKDAANGGSATLADLKAAQYVSMFQTNQIAFRAERYVNWAKRRATAVAGVNSTSAGGWQ